MRSFILRRAPSIRSCPARCRPAASGDPDSRRRSADGTGSEYRRTGARHPRATPPWLVTVRQSKLRDGAVVNLQVVDTNERTMELRALVSARNAPQAWDLRCEIREKLVAFLQAEMPEALPRDRADVALPSVDRSVRSFQARRQGIS
jgi:hypothetical protein